MRFMVFQALRFPVPLRTAARLFVLCALLIGAAAVPPVHAAKKEVVRPPDKEITITGLVEKAAVDENDKVIAVEIQVEGPDGIDYYLVNDDAKGSELLGLVGRQVDVSGIVDEDEDENKLLTVKEYSVK